MINKLYLYISENYNPYENIAVEAYLLESIEEGEALLYLWQNLRTVVIGKNQNVFSECDCEKLVADGGYIARRVSGGGAVYHDIGNLNFSFILNEADYDETRQTKIILDAVRQLSVISQKTGRNDLVIDNKKFSGHAYYKTRKRCLHHGTLLIDINNNDIEKYLTVSKEKLKSRGVDSVKSRVCCLKDYCKDLSIYDMEKLIIEACEREYGKRFEKWDKKIDGNRFLELVKKFSSAEWIYNRKSVYTHVFSNRYSWGGLEVGLSVNKNIIRKIDIYSDSMDSEFAGIYEKVLKGTVFEKSEIEKKLRTLPDAHGQRDIIAADFISLLCNNI